MKRVLVTGGAGYIGSHICKKLAKNGIEPITFDNLSTGHKDAVKWGPLVIGDLQDQKLLIDTFKKYKIDSVFHFAASAYVFESVQKPLKYYENNVSKTISLLNSMMSEGIRKIIFSSTCATFGTVRNLPINRSTPQVPINPYGQSKLMVEKILFDLSNNSKITYAILRYFNACGLDPDGELFENHNPEPHLIPRALMAASGEISNIEIYGNDYPTPDGTCIRDYIHVMDLADAHIKAFNLLENGQSSFQVNIGKGEGLSVMQIINSIEKITGKKVPYIISERRIGDPPILYVDSNDAQKILGFHARYSDIESIIKTAWPYFKNRSKNQ